MTGPPSLRATGAILLQLGAAKHGQKQWTAPRASPDAAGCPRGLGLRLGIDPSCQGLRWGSSPCMGHVGLKSTRRALSGRQRHVHLRYTLLVGGRPQCQRLLGQLLGLEADKALGPWNFLGTAVSAGAELHPLDPNNGAWAKTGVVILHKVVLPGIGALPPIELRPSGSRWFLVLDGLRGLYRRLRFLRFQLVHTLEPLASPPDLQPLAIHTRNLHLQSLFQGLGAGEGNKPGALEAAV
mmetsp:Transcript_57045/g.101886  ORF Transcript_57045/g.101886 Transcript_57045/m.101886 type:complete len:239 (+) Transcript_57045:638-1354(+)